MFECRAGNTVLHHREPSSPLYRGKGKQEARLEATALSRGVAMGMRRTKHKWWHTRRKIIAISSSNVLWIYSNFPRCKLLLHDILHSPHRLVCTFPANVEFQLKITWIDRKLEVKIANHHQCHIHTSASQVSYSRPSALRALFHLIFKQAIWGRVSYLHFTEKEMKHFSKL